MTARMTSGPRATEPRWEQALVYGMGLSGQAATRLLIKKGVAVVAVDRRGADELELGELAGHPLFEFRRSAELDSCPEGVDGMVVSPGVPWELPMLAAARQAGIPVIPEVELAFFFLDGPVVGITGSNGKSTTTALTGALLEAAGFEVEICGNIGVPLSARVEGPPGRVFVVELSSFQLQGVDAFRPKAAALLNLSPDHLDRHVDLSAYLAAKSSLFERQREDDFAILNADDPLVAEVGARARRRFFSRLRAVEDGCYLDGATVVEITPDGQTTSLFDSRDLSIDGVHNLENAMAAALLARSMGASTPAFPKALGAFHGLPHRMERIAKIGGVVWINDSKATNTAATLRSVEGLSTGSVHLILGGRGKGEDFDGLVEAADRIRRLYLIGETAEELERVLASRVPTERSGDLAQAVGAAGAAAQAGETVLLSPACASFDQYSNFAARGAHFRRLVMERVSRGTETGAVPESEGDRG